MISYFFWRTHKVFYYNFFSSKKRFIGPPIELLGYYINC